jgi:hypothetical protein
VHDAHRAVVVPVSVHKSLRLSNGI